MRWHIGSNSNGAVFFGRPPHWRYPQRRAGLARVGGIPGIPGAVGGPLSPAISGGICLANAHTFSGAPQAPRDPHLVGAAALFFVTLLWTLALAEQWLSVAWALEGAVLLWLYPQVRHEGLKRLGVLLLVICFVRLALNPYVITSYPRGEMPFCNWYLAAYGAVTLCLLLAGYIFAGSGRRPIVARPLYSG